MSEWIKCSDRLPESGVDVLINSGDWVGLGWYKKADRGDHYWEDAYTDHLQHISHWMPLPEPPKD